MGHISKDKMLLQTIQNWANAITTYELTQNGTSQINEEVSFPTII